MTKAKETARDPHPHGRRKRTEARPPTLPADVSTPRAGKMAKLVHELRRQLAELDHQNAELRRVLLDLETSRDHFAELYDRSPVGYLTLDAGGVISESNLAAARLLGLDRRALLKKRFSLFVEADSQDDFDRHCQTAFTAARPQNCELRLRRPDGATFRGRLETVAATARPGGPAQCLVTLSDVTERLRAEEIRSVNQTLEQRVRERKSDLEAANERLRGSEMQLRQAAQAGNVGLWDWDLQTNQVIYSPEWKRQIGFEEHEISNEFVEWQNRVHPEDLEPTLQKVRAVVAKEAPRLEAEFRFRHKDGSFRWILAQGSLVCDPDGMPQRMMGSHVDLTERRKTEQALHESEKKFRALFESAPVGIALHDANGHYLHTNRAYQQMLGYAEEELKGLGIKRVTHPDDIAEGQRQFGRLREGTQDSYQRKKRFVSKDGRLIWAEVSASGVRDQLGQLQFIISLVDDITERQKTDDQIRLLVNSVHSTQELICITDHENRLQFVNRAFLNAYGYTEPELLGRQPDFLYAPANAPGLCQQVYQQTLDGGWQGEVVNRCKDGTEFPIALNTSQIKDEAGRILGLVGVARDISGPKRAEKQSTAFALLGHRLNGATTPEQAAEIILEIASVLFGWDAGYVQMYSQTDDKIIPVLMVDTVDGRRTPIPPGTSSTDPSPLMRAVMQEGWRLFNRTGDSRAPIPLVPFGDIKHHSASMMYVPINARDTVLGILSIQSYTPHAYGERDLQLLQTLADYCGAALLRIEVTEARRTAEVKYQRIFEQATEGIVQTTPDGRYRSANPAAARILGYATPEELIAGVTDIGAQTYVQPEKRAELKRLLETQGFVAGFEAERLRKDGSKFWTVINAHVVRDATGTILYYEGTNQDITGRKQAEEETRRLPQRIIEAQEAERQRVARELHDGVNQLLASAKMRLRNVEEHLGAIAPAATEILRRCNRLLVQALEENRRIAHDLRPSDLDELGLITACRRLVAEFQSRTTLRTKTRFPRAWQRLSPAVELHLFRIVQEVLANVEKHAQAKTVHLSLAVADDVVVLRIRDDGRGFDPNASPPATKARRGIGLTNLRQRATAMDGTCELVSRPKQGTTITVRLPWAKAK